MIVTRPDREADGFELNAYLSAAMLAINAGALVASTLDEITAAASSLETIAKSLRAHIDGLGGADKAKMH